MFQNNDEIEKIVAFVNSKTLENDLDNAMLQKNRKHKTKVGRKKEFRNINDYNIESKSMGVELTN